MPLQIKCDRDYFKSVVAYAKSLGGKSWESFRNCMRSLGINNPGSVNEERKRHVHLYKDFAPYSFGFGVFFSEREQLIPKYAGGMICHGAGSNGAGGPEFSVTLSPQNYVHWQLHT